MIIKLVRENTAYYLQETLIPELYSKPVSKFRLMDLSEIVIDLDTDKVLKCHMARVESVFDEYVAGLNRIEREAGRPYAVGEEAVA
jgi:hypothetical protein